MSIGSRIKELREAHGLGQTELAEKISVSKQTMYKYENDIITNIPSDKIEKIAKVCNTTPEYIMGWTEEQTDDGYYINPETAQAAQEIFENRELRLLFDAARDASPEDLRTVHQMLLALKRKEQG